MTKLSAEDVPKLIEIFKNLKSSKKPAPAKPTNIDSTPDGKYNYEGLSEGNTNGYITGSGGGPIIG